MKVFCHRQQSHMVLGGASFRTPPLYASEHEQRITSVDRCFLHWWAQYAFSISHAQIPHWFELFFLFFLIKHWVEKKAKFDPMQCIKSNQEYWKHVRGGHCVIDWEYSAHGMVKWGNERGEWKVFYSISACQALLNCCVGCLETIILRELQVQRVYWIRLSPFFLFSLLLVFANFLYFCISI